MIEFLDNYYGESLHNYWGFQRRKEYLITILKQQKIYMAVQQVSKLLGAENNFPVMSNSH